MVNKCAHFGVDRSPIIFFTILFKIMHNDLAGETF